MLKKIFAYLVALPKRSYTIDAFLNDNEPTSRMTMPGLGPFGFLKTEPLGRGGRTLERVLTLSSIFGAATLAVSTESLLVGIPLSLAAAVAGKTASFAAAMTADHYISIKAEKLGVESAILWGDKPYP